MNATNRKITLNTEALKTALGQRWLRDNRINEETYNAVNSGKEVAKAKKMTLLIGKTTLSAPQIGGGCHD